MLFVDTSIFSFGFNSKFAVLLHCHIPEHLSYCEYISQTSLITKQDNQNVDRKHANQNVQVESCKHIQTCNQNMQVESCKRIQTCNQNMQNKNMQVESCKRIQTCNQNMQVESCKRIQTCNQNMQIKTCKLNHASASKCNDCMFFPQFFLFATIYVHYVCCWLKYAFLSQPYSTYLFFLCIQ